MQASSHSHLARRALGILVAVGCSLCAVELGARILSARTTNPELRATLRDFTDYEARLAAIRFAPDAELGYRLKPNYHYTGPGGGVTRHNAQGFRAAGDFGPKAQGTVRIACLGASTTYGVSVEDNADTYPAQLETQLRAKAPVGTQVEVLNFGVGGYTSLEVLGTLRRDVFPLQPDIVILQLAINDVAPRLYPDFDCSYRHFRVPMQPLPTSRWSRMLVRSHAVLTAGWALGWYRPLTLQARTQRPLPVTPEAARGLLAVNSPACFEANIREAIDLCQERGIQVYLLTQAYLKLPAPPGADAAALELEAVYEAGQQEHNIVLMALAAATRTPLIDLSQLTPRNPALFSDPIHMTVEGNRVKASLIAAELPL